ncbi:response regulator transcription factor [Coprobacter tertius]|uniref:Response regulator transcription factor n=1 Tax=Coprobacter tertius TaxID=2944915 RepID=A0ABT1MI79_9BACT|nr:response regulator transcription factor [Coprobacter tertius]MCP9612343.1 response regulator transcription factor [Coprobacter tertius]
MKTIILADNQAISREGLRHLIAEILPDIIPSESNSKKELLSLLSSQPEATVILDYTLFDFSGPEELINICERYTDSSWLLFSDELSDDFINRIVINHRFGFLLKDCSKEEILLGLQKTLSGHRYICNEISNQLISKNNTSIRAERLTATETEILKQIALGNSTKEIATIRHLSFHTVNTHRKNIFRKINVNNMHEATKYAMRAGIIDIAEYCI